MFKPKQANDGSVASASKTLLISHHGFGKTYQCRYLQESLGPGFIISGEAGLKSIEDCGIDYLDFSSWDGERGQTHDPENGVYSFKGIIKMINTPEFKKRKYKWLCIDSLTELSDRCMAWAEEEFGNNGFEKYGAHSTQIIGAMKYVRDLPMHIYVTALAAEEQDDNDQTHYWPLLKSKKVAKQVPALFDHVLCGIRRTSGDPPQVQIERFIITEEVKGWHGKVRDPRNRLRPVERCDNIMNLFDRMAMPDDEYEKWVETAKRKVVEAQKLKQKQEKAA